MPSPRHKLRKLPEEDRDILLRQIRYLIGFELKETDDLTVRTLTNLRDDLRKGAAARRGRESSESLSR